MISPVPNNNSINTVATIVIASLLAAGVAYLAIKHHWGLGIGIAVMSITVPLLLSLFFYIKFSIYLYIFLSIFIGIPLKMNLPVPIGLGVDFAILFTILGHLYKCSEMKDYKSTFIVPMMIPIALWIGWNVFQVVNPIAGSRVAWFFVMRPYVLYPILYFIAYYYFRSIEDIKHLFFFLLLCSYISSVWGVIQNINGYFPFEMDWVYANDAKHLVYISGRWRIFGTLASPAHFGMLMAIIIVAGAVVAYLYKWPSIIVIAFGTIISLPALVWSGTRTGIALVVVITAIIVGLWGNFKIYIAGGIFAFFFIILIITPSNNYHIQRIQSTFAGSEDTSYKEREENRNAMYPWIMKHPMGGGLGSTGVWGVRFSPGTMLANFAPDSGHIRVMVETGWIGYIIYMGIYFTFIWYSLRHTKIWKIKDTKLKVLLLVLFAVLCSFIIVEQAQDVNGILPFSIMLWIFIALLMRVIDHIHDHFQEMELEEHNLKLEHEAKIKEMRIRKTKEYEAKFNQPRH
ncbi:MULTISPECIES: O-antigen ligase family protein [Flammeovirga]|uniref:O-antigen ligase family protein n=1 Tax=Flammeovirga agarivorans TaxID=2726742 RepID=A0A7X8SQQ0_9BACT|nr:MULTISPECIES: O-antigen ligase family protein [Flammeovirga]NLR94581.1 O-antigen ligase family protein [Flammeovirga agarivorans]